jgi:hypothetical protein
MAWSEDGLWEGASGNMSLQEVLLQENKVEKATGVDRPLSNRINHL